VDATNNEYARPFRIAGHDRATFVRAAEEQADGRTLLLRRPLGFADREDSDDADEDEAAVPSRSHHPVEYAGVDRSGP
jgi:hypothetical protein